MEHSNILIVGGGCAGISVASRINSLKSDLSISIIEPSEKSLYQAAWTLVGAGSYDVNKTIKTMSSSLTRYNYPNPRSSASIKSFRNRLLIFEPSTI